MIAAQTGKTENMKEKSDAPALMDFYRDDEIKEIFDISGAIWIGKELREQ